MEIYHEAENLVGNLDFATVSHNHPDHYCKRFIDAMIKAKKPVISNFLPVGEYYSRPAKSFSFGDVKIQTYQTDHSPIWKEFVMVSEISIETGGERCIILHSGDTWDAKMLRPMKNKPDFWFVHPRIHLSVREGRTRLHPKTTLVAHLWVHSDW